MGVKNIFLGTVKEASYFTSWMISIDGDYAGAQIPKSFEKF